MLDVYRNVFSQHMPKGYELIWKDMARYYGYAINNRAIYVNPNQSDREVLFTFLHECGHVHSRHCRKGARVPMWREEYEADQYAIAAMRAEGIPVPRARIAHRKAVLRELIEDAEETVDDEVLRFAYGREWRKYR